MTEGESAARFREAAALLTPRLNAILHSVPPEVACRIQEIRLRAGRPIALDTPEGPMFLRTDGLPVPAPEAAVLTKNDLFESFRALCGYSVHTHQHELERGYLSLIGGHRAGVCGAFSGSGGGLREVSSINLRIARQIPGAAREVCRALFSGGLCGVLIAGAPSSGKTTLLRDMARTLASGEMGVYYKLALIDERGEFAAMVQGVPQNDVGLCSDVLSGYTKADGIEIAVRTLSPQVIVCDEIGRPDELDAVRLGIFSAVRFFASVHCEGREDLRRRPQARELLETGAFEKVVLLDSGRQPGIVQEILDASQL